MSVSPERIARLNRIEYDKGPVVYWMSRDQRATDNWALLYADELARSSNSGVAVVFCLVAGFLGATTRQYGFMLRGLRETASKLRTAGVPFFLLRGAPKDELPRFLKRIRAGALVTDFDPLRTKVTWKRELAAIMDIPLIEVDAHNIVPCRVASPKAEYGAYTLRPKIRKLLPTFLTHFPKRKKLCGLAGDSAVPVDWENITRELRADNTVGEVSWLEPGETAAEATLRKFISNKLPRYHEDNMDPMAASESNLSPYLHFGQIAPQRVALATRDSGANPAAIEAFLEQLIVRRELSDNFCFYNSGYDSTSCFPQWARTTISLHARDTRKYLYSRAQLEAGETHDFLWNAAQMEMVTRGKMQNYLRMYWAKKILEWTHSAEEAMEYAIFLNDRYEIDGRDPNGYAGIAWSMGGVHDRAWAERPIFGKIRYMSFNGCRTKFDIEAYAAQVKHGQG